MSLLSCQNISMRFGGIKAVSNLSFDIEQGEIFSIIGPNGAGKSTLFNLISRIYQESEGDLFFEGRNLKQYSASDIAKNGIARTFQNIELFEGASVLDNLLLGRHIHQRVNFLQNVFWTRAQQDNDIAQRHYVERIIDFLNLAAWRDQAIARLPYGVRKIVEVGRALAQAPKLILLDEPSSGLNPEESLDMSFWIKDIRDLLNITVIMIEHDMKLVHSVSDRVLAMNQGELITIGSSREVQSHKDVMKAYLG